MSLAKRLLGLPAWTWALTSASLATAALLTPWPGPPANPSAALFREPVLVARTTSGYEVVPFGRHEGIGPIWALSLQTTERASVHRSFGYSPGSKAPGLGFFRRHDQWTYQLTANRYDKESRTAPAQSIWLPPEEAKELRPLAVAELERRTGAAHHGVLLEELLDKGAMNETWVTWQNGLVLLAWLSIPVALWAAARPVRAGKSEKLTSLMREHFA